MAANWVGAASEQGGRTRRGGKACPLLGPIQSGPGLSLLRTGPRGPASWPPGSRPASPFPPPSGHTGLFLLLWHAAAFSLDSRKSGSFLSFGAPLKHHLGEVLSGHSPLLAHPFVIYPRPPTAQGQCSTNSGATGRRAGLSIEILAQVLAPVLTVRAQARGPERGKGTAEHRKQGDSSSRKDSGGWVGKITGVHHSPSPSPRV